MILHIQYPNTDRQFYRISDFEDLQPIFTAYPHTHDIAMSTDTLKEAVDAIVEYLSGHQMDAWVDEQDITKSLRDKALALGVSMATALAPGHLDHARPGIRPNPAEMIHTAEPKKVTTTDFGKHPMDRFLWNVRQIESSGGKNTQHKVIKYGVAKGSRAIGGWGLLKPTVSELVNRMRIKGELTPEYASLDNMSRDQLEHHLKENPQMELNLVRKLAGHVMERQKNDPHRAAYAWLHGHNLFPTHITKDKLLNSDYVSKYKNIDKVNPFTPKKTPAVMKKMEPVDSSDFSQRIKTWHKKREEELTKEPMRSSNFTPDMGRIRETELDQVKPSSMKTSEEIIRDNIKVANKR